MSQATELPRTEVRGLRTRQTGGFSPRDIHARGEAYRFPQDAADFHRPYVTFARPWCFPRRRESRGRQPRYCRNHLEPVLGRKVWAYFDGRQNRLRDVVGSLVSLVSGGSGFSEPVGDSLYSRYEPMALPGYALACMTTSPPFSTSMFKLCPSSSSIPTSGVLPVASASMSLGLPSQGTVT